MDRPDRLRAQVVALLRGGQAHVGFAEAVAAFPAALVNARPPNVGYTFWHLVEHVRRTQADILDYVTNPGYRELAWPDEYWPPPDARATKDDWDRSVAAFERDLEALIAVVEDARTDLFGTVPSGGQHTLLREALLVADHNAYHAGELGILRQAADAWPAHRSAS